ncbi:MAG: hypothetical protein JSR26_07430 [Proteobacteria bacterium]|nr:hypothetical protein [Pseudomonadota bacterium]
MTAPDRCARLPLAVLRARLLQRLQWHRSLHDAQRDPRNALARLADLRRWQQRRLAAGFAAFLAEPRTRPAAEFFLSDLYGDRDFSGRDRDVARVLPKMAKLLPTRMLVAATDGIELAALSHAFDLRMAAALDRALALAAPIDTAAYAAAYRHVGLPRLRRQQIVLVGRIGGALDQAVRMPALWSLLKMCRVPARLAGLDELQSFLERGFGAFRTLDGAQDFVGRIVAAETAVSRRLFAGDPDPFRAE